MGDSGAHVTPSVDDVRTVIESTLESRIDMTGSRVIALIDSLRLHDPAAFADDKVGDNTAIANAFIVVDGEPMTGVRDEEAIV